MMKSFSFTVLVIALARAAPILQPCVTWSAQADSSLVCTGKSSLAAHQLNLDHFNPAKRAVTTSIFARQDDDFEDFGDDSGFDSGSDDTANDGSGFDGSQDDSTAADDTSADDSSFDAGDGTPADDGSLDSTPDDSTDSADNSGLDSTDGLDTTDGGTDGTDGVADSSATDTRTDSTDATPADIADSPDGTDATDAASTDSAATADSTDSTDPTDTTAAAADAAATPSATADDAATSTTPDAAAEATPSADAAPASATCAASVTGPNAATIDLIKQFEGFVPSPKPDPIGLNTVGFGHKCVTANCAEVPFSFPLSQSTAAQLLSNDAGKFVNCLQGFIGNNVVLNDNQFGALTAFAFNLGCGTVQSSTLLKRLNSGEDPNTVAAAEIPRFNKAGGKVLAGLTRRRAGEVALFQTPSDVVAHPLC